MATVAKKGPPEGLLNLVETGEESPILCTKAKHRDGGVNSLDIPYQESSDWIILCPSMGHWALGHGQVCGTPYALSISRLPRIRFVRGFMPISLAIARALSTSC